ncbi:hypothetical protein TWF281_000903 [Arthrobotrys megalospora]
MGFQLRLSLFLVVLIQIATKSLCACYYPNGDLAPDDIACSLSQGHSACCGADSICFANGLCFDVVSVNIARGSCTDQSWGSPQCPQICSDKNDPDERPGGGLPIFRCYDGSWCCGAVDFSCCTDGSSSLEIVGGSGFGVKLRPADLESAGLEASTLTITSTTTITTTRIITSGRNVVDTVTETESTTETATETTTVSDVDTITETESTTETTTVSGVVTVGSETLTSVSTIYLPTGGTGVETTITVYLPTGGAGAEASVTVYLPSGESDAEFEAQAESWEKKAMILGIVLGVLLAGALISLVWAGVKIFTLRRSLMIMNNGIVGEIEFLVGRMPSYYLDD